MEIIKSTVATFPFKSLKGMINGEQKGIYIAAFCKIPSPEVVMAEKYARSKEMREIIITGIIAEFKSSILLTEAPQTAFITA